MYCVLMYSGLVPLFTIDVWEHAYYLQYKNMRPDFVKAIWNIANWKDISDNFAKAKSAWLWHLFTVATRSSSVTEQVLLEHLHAIFEFI